MKALDEFTDKYGIFGEKLQTPEELEAINIMRKALNGLKPDEATDRILDMFSHTRNNVEFVNMVKKNRFI